MTVRIVTIKDVMLIFDCSYNTAQRKLKAVKDSLSSSKKKKTAVTTTELAKELLLDDQLIIDKLKLTMQ